MPKLEIDILAKVDDAVRDIKKLNESVGDVGDTAKRMAQSMESSANALDGFSGKTANIADIMSTVTNGFAMGQEALGYLNDAFQATVIRAAEWGDSMGDLAQLTGQSVEDTSRLAATLELVGIDASSLGRILKSMTKEGLNLNLKTLLELNEEYNAIQDPVQRNTFLFRNFGKAAEDMAEVMGRSQEELEALAAAADKSGKVIGEEAAAQAEKFNTQLKIAQQQLDGTQTQLGGATLQLGIFAAQGLRDAIRGLGQFSDSISEGTSAYDMFVAGLIQTNPKLIEFAAAFDEVRGKANEAKDAVDDNTRGVEAWGDRWAGIAQEAKAAKAMQDAKQAASDLRDELAILNAALGGEVAEEQEDFYQRQKDAATAITDTKDQIAALEAKSYLTPEQKTELEELKIKLDEQVTAIEKNRDAHEEAAARIVFSMIQQQMAVDGLSTEEIAALTDIGQELGVYDQKTADIMRSVQRSVEEHGANAQAILGDVRNAYAALRDEPDITKRITVETHYVKYGDENPSFSPGDGGGGSSNSTITPDDNEPVGPGYAQGGSFIVPGSGTGDRPYTVNLTPGERVDVTPVGKAPTGGITFAEGSIVVHGGNAGAAEIVDQLLAQLGARVRAYAGSGYAFLGG